MSMAIEALARGWGTAPGYWPGRDTQIGRPRADAIAMECAGVDRWDLACLLWSCGRDEAAIRADVWACLMLDAVKVMEQTIAPPGAWPKGMLSGLVRAAIEEMRPHDPRNAWTDARRIRASELQIDRSNWSRTWGARYRAVLECGRRREGSARIAVCGRINAKNPSAIA
jgi:hypothetical protein